MKILEPAEFLKRACIYPTIDVRSPAEFAYAHVPRATNIPLFDNDERARVGTCYKQVGRDEAVLLGLELVGPKLADFVKQSRLLAPHGEVLVHCWRGGMRSGSFAWLLETAGMQVSTLKGGYKAYRNFVLSDFETRANLIILGGKTGSGKTDILKQLAALGEQVIDLEGLANHKGSSYGAIGQVVQPSSEQFENLLHQQWQSLDLSRRIWVEDESRKVGNCYVPMPLWHQMVGAPVAFVDIPKEIRISRLVNEYACFEHQLLVEATDRIKKRLGGQHHQAAIEALAIRDYAAVADITLTYYDKAYLYGIAQRARDKVSTIEITENNPTQTAQTLLEWANRVNY